MIKILFVCLGNICRSATAEAVMNAIIKRDGLTDRIITDSAGILSVHKGEKADSRMRKHASNRNYEITSISRPVVYNDFDTFDLIIGMDNSNIDDLYNRAPSPEAKKKIRKMTDFCTVHNNDYVPDPYYGGDAGFELVLDLLEDACEGLAFQIKNKTL